jgi:hypothetical protein
MIFISYPQVIVAEKPLAYDLEKSCSSAYNLDTLLCILALKRQFSETFIHFLHVWICLGMNMSRFCFIYIKFLKGLHDFRLRWHFLLDSGETPSERLYFQENLLTMY